DKITKSYPDGTVAVHGIDLEIADGEFIILVGPSGCGKSTTLNMIAGLEDITSGELRMAGERVNDKAPHPPRRAAAAGGEGPGHRPHPQGVPHGRAAVEPRREAAGADADAGLP